MKRFKLIDMWISIILITGFLISSLILRNDSFFIGYFVVGGWQTISMVIHQLNKWFTEKATVRFYYHRIVLIIFIIAGTGFLIPTFFFIMYILLFAAPFMAAWYTYLCYIEVYIKMQRPLALLK